MKDIWKNGVIILLIISVLYIIFLRECERPEPCPPKGKILIAQQTWDSIQALANKQPIVKIDTIYLKGEIVYVDKPLPPPQIDLTDTTINIYHDTLLKKDIDVNYTFKVRGELLNRKWTYRPIITTITIDSLIYIPKIVEVEKFITQAKNGLYAYGLAGGNGDNFLFGGGLDLITKKETMIGYQFQKFGSDNLHFVKIGVRLGGKK